MTIHLCDLSCLSIMLICHSRCSGGNLLISSAAYLSGLWGTIANLTWHYCIGSCPFILFLGWPSGHFFYLLYKEVLTQWWYLGVVMEVPNGCTYATALLFSFGNVFFGIFSIYTSFFFWMIQMFPVSFLNKLHWWTMSTQVFWCSCSNEWTQPTRVILLRYREKKVQWESPWDEWTKIGLKRIICFHISVVDIWNNKESGEALVKQVNGCQSPVYIYFSSPGTEWTCFVV